MNERGDEDADNLGYVHRFPDLLKRWDDVDGDRGTWCMGVCIHVPRVEGQMAVDRFFGWQHVQGPGWLSSDLTVKVGSSRCRSKATQELVFSLFSVRATEPTPRASVLHLQHTSPTLTDACFSRRYLPYLPYPRYEKMKRRLLRVEMERRRSEHMRKERERGGKTADELRAASSRSRLARAGFRRPPAERRASIMHIGGGEVSRLDHGPWFLCRPLYDH